MLMRTRLACVVLAMTAGAACTDTDSATNLNPAGPPMVRQVRLTERYLDSSMTTRDRVVFAFGTHPLADPSEVHAVSTALAVGNHLRVIVDELLVGNNLEEIACRGAVDDDPGGESYGRIPLGADPDDVARCAGADDVLRETCKGSDSHSVCICQRDGGCFRGSAMVGRGEPVGVLDVNQDGSADDMRFIAGAVGIQCGSINVPINLETSYWNPSGDQNRPAMGGFDALGPALVLETAGALPTGLPCSLTFSPDVVDKQGVAVCVPPEGDVAAGCTPGDLSAFSFGVEPLAISSSTITDGQTNVSRTPALLFNFLAPLDPGSIQNIQIAPAPPTPPVIAFAANTMNMSVRLDFTGGPLAAQTQYTVTLPTTITDAYGRPLKEARTLRFTTGN
ncbi:MAG TPA: Ig-like domain-containing protein [Kofleriaceae bacterium]|nr:Ig-like domain-containing protein [Kofleriaceae bacterium]